MPLGEGWDFTIEIPEGWYIRDPDRSTREQGINEFTDAAIAADPDRADQRAEMIDRFLTFAADADDRSAIIAAMLWEPSDEVPIAADVRIHEAERDAPDDLDQELARLVQQLSQVERGDLGPREAQIVDLPVGPAVRLRLLTQTDPDRDGSTVALDVVQHWVPVPEQPDLVVISGSTPNLVAADDIVAMFDQIASTMRFEVLPS